jgi:hypothetical protein
MGKIRSEDVPANEEREVARQEEQAWSNLSLASVLRDDGDEDEVEYTTSDLKTVFQKDTSDS